MQLHDILLLRTSAILPEAISAGDQPQVIKELVEGRIIT